MVILFTGGNTMLAWSLAMSSALALCYCGFLSLFSREDDGIAHFIKTKPALVLAYQRQSSL